MEDVIFMLHSGVIELGELERHFQTILPQVAKFDIDPREFRAYFAEIAAENRSEYEHTAQRSRHLFRRRHRSLCAGVEDRPAGHRQP